ncbi:MAG: hypothetical protein AB7F91_06175 [Parvularculaceae bacterium]
MILRRVIEHFRKQEWTAIAIDFAIVVIGVFVGIQVSNWNAARQTREAADQYGQRLVADLREDAYSYIVLQNYYRGALKAAETAYEGLSDQTDIGDAAFLIAVFRASQYNFAERHRATFDELVASGSLDLIHDLKLRNLASSYYNIDLLEKVSRTTLNSEYRRYIRMTLPPGLHQALGVQCGDRQVEGASFGIFTIDYPCDLDWPEAEVAAVASQIRAYDGFKDLLRLRIANLSTHDFELQNNREIYGLETFLETETAP